jgi:hypothetical protein
MTRNWRWLVLPLVPTVTILHVRWLCYLAHQPWPSDGAMFLSFMGSVTGVMVAAAWAGFKF